MIPKELQQRKQWICWKYEQIPGRSKPTKVPYDPISGYKAKSTDRTTWTDFNTAIKNASRYDGIGFVFTKEDPYVGIDLDHVLNEKGEFLTRDAKSLYEMCSSYTEISPSGTGIHIIGKAKLRDDAPHRVDGNEERGTCAKELYDSGRYFTFTGHQLGVVNEINDLQLMAEALEDQIIPQEQKANKREAQTKTSEIHEESNLIAFTRKVYPELNESNAENAKALVKKASEIEDILKETEIKRVVKAKDLFIDYERNGRKGQVIIKDEGVGFHIPENPREQMEYLYAKMIRAMGREEKMKQEKVPELGAMTESTKALYGTLSTSYTSGRQEEYVNLHTFGEKLNKDPAVIWNEIKTDMSRVPELGRCIRRIYSKEEGVKGILVSREISTLFERSGKEREQALAQENKEEAKNITNESFRPIMKDALISTEYKASFRWLQNQGVSCHKLDVQEMDGKNYINCAADGLNLSSADFKGISFTGCDMDRITTDDKTNLKNAVWDKCRFESDKDLASVIEAGATIKNCMVHMKDPQVKDHRIWNLINAEKGKIQEPRLKELIPVKSHEIKEENHGHER